MKKNLLLFTDGFPFGEKERSFISTEFEYLIQNYNVTVVALTSNTELTHEIPKGVNVYNLAWKKSDLIKQAVLLTRRHLTCEILKARKSGRTSSVTSRRVIRHNLIAIYYEKWIRNFLKNNPVDIIYTYWCTSATLAAVRVKEKNLIPGLKVVSRFHGYDLYNDRTEGADWQPFREEISSGLDKLVFISETGKQYYLDTWRVAKEKCAVSYLGCKEYENIAAIKDNDAEHVIISCSECKNLKRIDLIIDSLAMVPDGLKIKWLHLGVGSEFDALKQRAKEKLSEKENVSYEFIGWLDHDKLQNFYSENRAELFITLSETEGLPISVTESIAMGIPAIATDVGGMKELINEKTGYLVDKDISAGDVATIIENHFSKTVDDRKKMSECAYQHWKDNFNADCCAQNFIKILCDL